MTSHLLISVGFHDGRYHGRGEERPSPARLFQALVAAASRPGIVARDQAALEWLERLSPPVMALPRMREAQTVMLYVPNNDLDAVGGDPARTADIRVGKTIEPKLFDPAVPFLFAWELEEPSEHADVVCEQALRLYQLGCGIDMAWAQGEVVDGTTLEERLERYPGEVLRPGGWGGEASLPCPVEGSFASLEARFIGAQRRFERDPTDADQLLLRQPPKARFRQVNYEAQPHRQLFELRSNANPTQVRATPLDRIHDFVTSARDAAADRLRGAMPGKAEEINLALVGLKHAGNGAIPPSARVRLMPLPSIGHEHADRQVRRMAVEVPRDSALNAADVFWAFSGLELPAGVLVHAWDERMLTRYVQSDRAPLTVWRTVTAAVLPQSAARRRIEPARRHQQAKGGRERSEEERRACEAVLQALRHSGVRARVEAVRVQREPFERQGEKAELFAEGTRFPKERMWHVELVVSTHIAGPLMIGDGRFVGLGLMVPAPSTGDVHAFSIESGLTEGASPEDLARALRRAVMARAQAAIGDHRRLPAYFSGHDEGGQPAEGAHLSYVADLERNRLLILAPRDSDREAGAHRRTLALALEQLFELRAGKAGRLALRPASVEPDLDPLLAASRTWKTVTPYLVNRHSKGGDAKEALAADLKRECRRRGLPTPHVTATSARGIKGVGLTGEALLRFEVAVPGPICLGRSRHIGGGVFGGERCFAATSAEDFSNAGEDDVPRPG